MNKVVTLIVFLIIVLIGGAVFFSNELGYLKKTIVINNLSSVTGVTPPSLVDVGQVGQVGQTKGVRPPLSVPLSSEPPLYRVLVVGDIMLDRGVEYRVEVEAGGDFNFPFALISDYLNEADLVFANLEGVISDKGMQVGSIYSFRMNPIVAGALQNAGFDILSLANNHMFDFQRIALEDTMQRLKEQDIDYVGAGFNKDEAFSVRIKEINGTKIGFLAYTNVGPGVWSAIGERPGIAWVDSSQLEQVKKTIKQAKQKTDVLIVSLHSGVEYGTSPTSFQTLFARTAIDAGADLVIGHHSHVIQESEKYQDKWIFYGLGNFVFDQGFSDETMQGLLLEVIISEGKINEVIPHQIQLSPFFQSYLE